MAEWQTVPIGELFKLKQGTYLKPEEMADEQTDAFPFPVYGANGVIGYSNRKMYSERTTLISCRGANCGVVHYTVPNIWISNNSIACVPITEIDPEFYYYVCLNTDFGDVITGSAQPQITITNLSSKQFIKPPLPTQRRIAGILSAYDELIENNQRRIRILEDMARSLYREWFVRFRYPGHDSPRPQAGEGLEVRASFVDSPLGQIPQGWEVKKLNEIAENFDRLRKPLSKMQRARVQGEYPYYGAAKVFDYINDYIFDGEYLLMAEDGSVITTERAPVLQLVNEKFWPNNHTHVLRGKQPYSTHFLYLGLSDVDISPYITGAAQPKITQENMNRIPFFCGPDLLHQKFNRLVESLIRQSQMLQRQTVNLRRTRDLLLPRLLSGGITIEKYGSFEKRVG